jgi:hypothetical protein
MWRGAQKGSRRRLNQHRGAGEAPSGSFARETSSANEATLPPEDVDTATSSHVLNVTELELPTITAQPGQPAPERSGHRFINPQYQPSIASITLSKGRSTVSAPALREEHRLAAGVMARAGSTRQLSCSRTGHPPGNASSAIKGDIPATATAPTSGSFTTQHTACHHTPSVPEMYKT